MLFTHALGDHELNEIVQTVAGNGHHQEYVFQRALAILVLRNEKIQQLWREKVFLSVLVDHTQLLHYGYFADYFYSVVLALFYLRDQLYCYEVSR